MASYTVATAKHATLVATVADTVTLTSAPATVEVESRGTDELYVTLDGTTPTVGGDDTLVVPAGTSMVVTGPAAGMPVSVVSSGATPYSVTSAAMMVIETPSPLPPNVYQYAGYWTEVLLDGNGAPQKLQPFSVYLYGTSTPATVYTDASKAVTAGSLSTDSLGNGEVFADPGQYDIHYGSFVKHIAIDTDSRETLKAHLIGIATGIAALGADGKVPGNQLPPGNGGTGVTSVNGQTGAVTGVEVVNNRGAVSGYASLDSAGKVPLAQVPVVPESQVTNLASDLGNRELTANKGAANGYASLDTLGKVPSGQLPSGVGGTTYIGSQYFVMSSGSGVAGDGTTDDVAALEAFYNSTLAGSTIVHDARTYALSRPLRYPDNRQYVGLGEAWGDNPAKFVLLNGANPSATGGTVTGVVVPLGWSNNSATPGHPTSFKNLCFDGNRANNTGNAAGLVILGYWTDVADCRFANAPKYGLLITDQLQNGTSTGASTTGSMPRVENNYFSNNGSDAFHQTTASSGNNLDGWFINNAVESSGGHGVQFDTAAGWSILGNHIYGVQKNGINCSNAGGASTFATHVANNYIEDYGAESLAGTSYYGIHVVQAADWDSSVTGNQVACQHATGAGVQYGHYLIEGTGTNAGVMFANNTGFGAGLAKEYGLVTGANGGHLYLYGNGSNGFRGFVGGQDEVVETGVSYLGPTTTPASSNLTVQSADYVAAANDVVLMSATGANRQVTLPAGLTSGTGVTVKKTDSSVNTVSAVPASGTIDGGASVVLSAQNETATAITDGTNWFVV